MKTKSVDYGAGNIKVKDADTSKILASLVAAVTGEPLGKSAGLRQRTAPPLLSVDGNRFYVGPGAHDWGRPVENLDDGRFVTGSPEMRALIYAAIGDCPGEALHLIIGLPQSALADGAAQDTAQALKAWLIGEHHWTVDGVAASAVIERVTVSSQAAGALFDYLLDDAGHFIPARKAHFKQELGIVSLGMNTLELLVVRDGVPITRFTSSTTNGVRRLLELLDPQGLYSRGELDEQLRTGGLDISKSTPVWGSEVVGQIERVWGNAFKRFAGIILVGGGVGMIQTSLVTKFNGKSILMPDPILSVARGLYKLALMKGQ